MKQSQDALVWFGGELRLVTRELRPPSPSEVILKLTSIGLCSSDVHIWAGRKSGAYGVLGHEGSGEIVAVGTDVTDWRPGDHVIVNPLLNCGACPDCQQGRGHICPDRQIIGYNGGGLMASFQTVNSRSLISRPPTLPLSHGFLTEPLACVVHAQDSLERTSAKSTTLILGCGPMGALHAAYAKYRGAKKVLVTDPSEYKLALARSRGIAADVWSSLHAIRSELMEMTGGRGADVCIIATSTRSGHELSFELAADGGQVLAFASIMDHPGPIQLPDGPFDSDNVHRREDRVSVKTCSGNVTVVGAIGFDSDSFLKSAILLSGPIAGEQFITRQATLADVPELIKNKWQDHLKILVVPGHGEGQHAVPSNNA